MLTFLLILLIVASVLLIVVILAQNPKGGGLSPAFSGINTQIVGVRQTTDFLEKATWYIAIGIIAVVLFSGVLVATDVPRGEDSILRDEQLERLPFQQVPQQQQQQQQQVPFGEPGEE